MLAYRFDLGCGIHKKEGYIGVDKEKVEGVDLVADLDKKLPIESNSAMRIRLWNVLEHIKDLDFTMNEVWRICMNEALTQVSGKPHTIYGWDESEHETNNLIYQTHI